MSVHANIREIRKKRGLTQSELAALIGKSLRMVQKYEADEESKTSVVPSLDVLAMIASALNVDIAELQGIDTIDGVYSKLNILNELFEEAESNILYTRSLIDELVSKKSLTDGEKKKLDDFKANLQILNDHYIFILGRKNELTKEFDYLLEEYAKVSNKNLNKFYTNMDEIIEEPFWLFSKYVKKQFAENYKELVDNLDVELLDMFEKTNDYVEMLLIKENQELNNNQNDSESK